MPRSLLALLALSMVFVAACGGDDDEDAPAARPSGPKAALVERLQRGGHVLVFRHATTENTTDRPETVGDCSTQRNLNDEGRREARAVGAAIKALDVPVAEALTSPFCRTSETAELMFGEATEDERLSTEGIGTPAVDRRKARELRALTADPPDGGNRMLVTHTGNIGAAFDESVIEGEALVFDPRAGGELVGRIAVTDWERLNAG